MHEGMVLGVEALIAEAKGNCLCHNAVVAVETFLHGCHSGCPGPVEGVVSTETEEGTACQGDKDEQNEKPSFRQHTGSPPVHRVSTTVPLSRKGNINNVDRHLP